MSVLYLTILGCIAGFFCPADKEPILFSSGRQGNSDIFIMEANGDDPTPLTHSPYEEWGPTWISAGEISFLREIDGKIHRVGMNLQSRTEYALPHPSHCILDDKNILYKPINEQQLYSCKGDIFLSDPSVISVTNITGDLDGQARYPAWNHDFSAVVFTSNHRGSNDIYMWDIKSTSLTALTQSEHNNEIADLSPDGQYIVYSTDRFEEGNPDIVIQDLASGKIHNISQSPGTELIARYAQSGKDIYYGSNKDGNWELYVYNISSRQASRLTRNEAFDGDPRVFRSYTN